MKILKNYKTFITSQVKGRSVLYVGCAEYSDFTDDCENRYMFYEHLIKHSKKVVGIDKNINGLKKKGFDVRKADAESPRKIDSFDVVIITKAFNHLKNPGMFMEFSKKNLKNGGKLIVRTPNSTSFLYISNAIAGRLKKTDYYNPTHFGLYNHHNLEALFKHYGFRVSKKYYVNTSKHSEYLTIVSKHLADDILVTGVKEEK